MITAGRALSVCSCIPYTRRCRPRAGRAIERGPWGARESRSLATRLAAGLRRWTHGNLVIAAGKSRANGKEVRVVNYPGGEAARASTPWPLRSERTAQPPRRPSGNFPQLVRTKPCPARMAKTKANGGDSL